MHKIKNIEKKNGSIAEISVEISNDAVESRWSGGIKILAQNAKIDGFRPGHIPEKILVERFGELVVLEEAAKLAINEAYQKIISETDLKTIGFPKILITKIAKGSPLEILITVSTIPEIKLPDYAKIAKKIMAKEESFEVTDLDVEKVIEELKTQRRLTEKNETAEVDIEFVKKLGSFNDMDDFKIKIRQNLKSEKEYKAREKKRVEIVEAIRKDCQIDVPDILIESELNRMIGEFSQNLTRMNKNFEQYKKDTGTTEENIRKEWREKARERAQNELMIFEIARKELLRAKKEDIEREVKHMIEHFPESPKERIEEFVEEALTKEEVFKFLEAQGK